MLVVPPRALLNPVQLTRGRRVSWTPLQAADSRRNAAPLSTHQLLACVLAMWHAQHQHASSISPMDAFFLSLPTQFDTTPLTWALHGKASLLEALPPSATHKHRMVRARYEADWTRVRALDKVTLASIWSCISFIPEPPPIDEHDFIWGWLCVNSRCVYMDLHYAKHEDNFTLAPLLDMANHTKHPKKECRVRFSSMDGLELYAPLDASLQEGEEVCITYGLHDNATLLTEYGFVLSHHVGEDDWQKQANHWHGNPHAGVWLDEAVEYMVQSQGEAGAWKRSLLQQADTGETTLYTPVQPRLILRIACTRRSVSSVWTLIFTHKSMAGCLHDFLQIHARNAHTHPKMPSVSGVLSCKAGASRYRLRMSSLSATRSSPCVTTSRAGMPRDWTT